VATKPGWRRTRVLGGEKEIVKVKVAENYVIDPCRSPQFRRHYGEDYSSNVQTFVNTAPTRIKVAGGCRSPRILAHKPGGQSKECLPAQHNFTGQHNFVAVTTVSLMFMLSYKVMLGRKATTVWEATELC